MASLKATACHRAMSTCQKPYFAPEAPHDRLLFDTPNSLSTVTERPDALEQLIARFHDDPMAADVGASIESVEVGSAVMVGSVGARHVNFLGGAHGGLLFTYADIAMAFASNSHGQVALAIRLDISFMRGVSPGQKLVATATTSHVSRRLGHHRVDVEADGRLVAQASGTTMRTGEWHFGREAWPEDWPH